MGDNGFICLGGLGADMINFLVITVQNWTVKAGNNLERYRKIHQVIIKFSCQLS